MGPFIQAAGAPSATAAGAAPPSGFPMPPGLGAPQPPDYATETQADGTVLLRVKMPDGSLGPVVKIVSVPKPSMKGPQAG